MTLRNATEHSALDSYINKSIQPSNGLTVIFTVRVPVNNCRKRHCRGLFLQAIPIVVGNFFRKTSLLAEEYGNRPNRKSTTYNPHHRTLSFKSILCRKPQGEKFAMTGTCSIMTGSIERALATQCQPTVTL